MKCPSNSHYEVCADACSAACPGLTKIVQCSTSCTEGCECDAGFLFNGQRCVKETECGCYEKGKTYKPGDVVYEDDCSTKCTCNPATGLVCEKHSCPQSTKCMILAKMQNAGSKRSARIRTVKLCVPLITEKNDNRGSTVVSYVKEVEVSVYGYSIVIVKNLIGKVKVNGELLNLPVRLGDGEVSVIQSGPNALVETNFGLIVSYDWNWYLIIKLPSSYYDSVCGLCGNFNGNAGDELQNPAGKAVSSVIEWGKSWQTSDQDKDHPCWDTCEKNCPTCDGNIVKLYETEASCGALAAKTSGVFQECHGKVDPQAFMNSCVYDVCMNKGDMKMLCQALASYSKQCRENGIIIKDWRKKFGCPMNCEPHSHYEDCASPCQPSCPFPEQKQTCNGACVEACQPGLVPFKVTVQNDHRGSLAVSYTRTVTFSIYGITITISREYPYRILLNGQLALLPLDYNNELVVFVSGWTAIVETVAGITVTFDWQSTVSVTLPSTYQGAVCGLCGNYNGKAQDDLTMPNGQNAPDGAKLGESWQVALVPGCSSACQGAWCQACSDAQKKEYQAQKYCGIIADKAGPFKDCHSRVDPAPYMEDCVYDVCQYKGHHGTLCDAVKVYLSACQSLGITIQSWRTDTFCQCVDQCICGENGAVSCQKAKCRPGEICKGNEKYGNGKVAVTKSVAVAVYDYVIYIQQGMPWKVVVNDELLNLPLSLDNGRLRVNQEGRNIIVRTDFGLIVLYDTVYYVEVIVPSTYQNKMCGLCGNYNNNGGDDFILPDGKQTNTVDDFGKAWVVDLPGYVCGGCGGQCPVCDQAKATLYGKPESCGIISAPNGPFKACHSKIDPAVYVSHCVFDVCAVDGNKDTLCNSVQAYALACQSAGVQIQPWRSGSFCPASCPPHSHYEVCADTCDGTCASFIYPSTCSESCFEGCQCDAGYVFDGVQCVSLDNCGCVYNGKYLMVGQAVTDKDCKSKCVCQASGLVKCENLSCASGEVCDVRDGVRGCHVKQGQCGISQVSLLSSFDGMSGEIGAQGAFTVASLCDETAALWFRVVVDVRVCSKGVSPTVATVYVFFKEAIITVNSQHVTWVNGKKVSLPSKVTGEISVSVSEKFVIIERASAVRVTYSVSQEVSIIIDSSLSDKMCGACGNYNNNSKDDMTTSDGKITTDVSVVVSSWSAGDFSRCGL
ncbi:hypothetical protein Q8A73_008080 [Channa argus]|nr:hypothetical protein Q8A73_008080 [Channa argus]